MPSPTHAPAPPPALVASAEGGLPADIVKAIDKFEAAAWDHGFGRRMQSSDPASRAVLTATILSRLAAAESARDEAVERAETAEFLQRAAQSTRDAFEVDLSAALARAERLEEALRECVNQIEYEHGKFGGTGSGETVLYRTRALLAEETKS